MRRAAHKLFKAVAPERRTLDGVVYDSLHEARFAQWAYSLLRAGEIEEIVEQVRVNLVAGYRPKIDFLIIPRTSFEALPGTRIAGPFYADPHGVKTTSSVMLMKMWKMHGRLPLVLVWSKGPPTIVEGKR